MSNEDFSAVVKESEEDRHMPYSVGNADPRRGRKTFPERDRREKSSDHHSSSDDRDRRHRRERSRSSSRERSKSKRDGRDDYRKHR
jgi:hypothetical protein